MTIEEAIKHCMDIAETQEMCSNGKKCAEEHRQLAEWLKELKVLKEQEPCEDAISRQAVLEGLRTCYDTETKEYSDGSQWINYEDAVAEVENLPSVTPQPKIGRWIRKTVAGCFVYGCDNCGWQQLYATDFCPDCRTKMVKPQESEVQDADSD